jgi:hypothetical protein
MRSLRSVCALIAIIASLSPMRAQTVNFDSPGDLVNNFTFKPTATSSNYSQVPTGGITGGAVDVRTGSDVADAAFFHSSIPSPGGAVLTTSLFFRYDSTLRNSSAYGFPLGLGFSRSNAPTAQNSGITAWIDVGGYLETYNDTTDRMFPVIFGANGETHAGSTATLLSGHWYRFSVNVQPIGGTGRAGVSMSVVDFGISGQNAQIYFPSFSQEVFAFSGNSPTSLFPVFRSFQSAGVDLLDDFSVGTGGTLPGPSRLANISTRGRVASSDETLIAGIIVQGDTPKRIIVRAIGPSLSQFGVAGAVNDPIVTLFDASGNQIAQNNDWRSTQQQEIIDTHLAPTNDLEAAIVISLPPANYTAVVTPNGASGVGLVEVYDLQ